MRPRQVFIRVATLADAGAIAEVHVASWRETYAGLLPPAMLAGLSVDDRTASWERILKHRRDQGGSDVFVGECEGIVAGFASGGTQRDDKLLAQGFSGEISAIYVLQRAQGRGMGLGLMAELARSLSERGHRSASLWVLHDNSVARRFYERLGGEIVGRKEERREAGTLVEMAYGWRELDSFLSRLGSDQIALSGEE